MCFGRALLHVADDNGKQLAVHVIKGISLLRDRKTDQLQGRTDCDLFKTSHLFLIRGICFSGFHDASDDLIAGASVRSEIDHQCQVIVRPVDPVNDLVVKSIRGDDAGTGETLVQKILRETGDKSAEDISGTEVQPCRIFLRILPDGIYIKTGETDIPFFPLLGSFQFFTCHRKHSPETPLHVFPDWKDITYCSFSLLPRDPRYRRRLRHGHKDRIPDGWPRPRSFCRDPGGYIRRSRFSGAR